MESYLNLGGDSSVIGFDFGSDWIDVYFSDGSGYRYTNNSAGRNNIEEMKKLARAGQGLNSYIHYNVKYKYSSKFQ